MTDEHDVSIHAALTTGAAFRDEIQWQMDHETWRVKGFPSWEAFWRTTYAGLVYPLEPGESRPQLMAAQRAKGHTQQDIATTFGVSQQTVSRDLNTHMGVDDEPVTIPTARGSRPARYAPRDPEPVDYERQNAERLVDGVAYALGLLSSLTVPESRERTRRAFAEHADAAPPATRDLIEPDALREIAAGLMTYAEEVERHVA